MVTHMKTTVEIPDPILNQARELAAREGTTVKALIELEFHLRRATFKEHGLQPELRDASWEQLRELVYEEHGG